MLSCFLPCCLKELPCQIAVLPPIHNYLQDMMPGYTFYESQIKPWSISPASPSACHNFQAYTLRLCLEFVSGFQDL